MSIKSFVSAQVFRTLAKGTVLLLVFLLPIFFLNYSVEVLETSKQLVLIVLSVFALLFWLVSVLLERKVSCHSWLLSSLPLLFLGTVFLSSIFSLAGYRTWIGENSQEYTSFLTLFSFVALFYTTVDLAKDQGFRKRIFRVSLVAASLAALLAWPSLFGWNKLTLLPEGLSNSVGSVTSFVIYLLTMAALGLAVWLSLKKKNPAISFSVLIVLATVLLFCLSIDFWLLWLLLSLACLFLLVEFFRKEVKKSKIVFLSGLFLVSLFFVFFPSPIDLKTSIVVTPSFNSSWQITKGVLLDNPRQLFFGTGPGTFVYDYAKYKTPDINTTVLWSLNFDRAKANFFTSLATLGILSAGLWLTFVLVVLLKIFNKKIDPVFVIPWLVVLLGQIFYTSNLTLAFTFWILSAVLVAQMPIRKEIVFNKTPRSNLLVSLGFVVVGVVLVILLCLIGGRYASEVIFSQAVRLDQAEVPTEQVTGKIKSAISFNRFSELYYKNYSQALLKELNGTLINYPKDVSEFSEEQKAVVQNLLLAVLSAADQAVQLAPNDVAAWSQRAKVYSDVIGLVGEAEDVAAASYLVANKLEPTNPSHLTNLGHLYLVVADRAIDLSKSEDSELAAAAQKTLPETLASAEEYLGQAIALKTDYVLAYYYLAAVYERQNKIGEAVARLEELLKNNPNSTGIQLQLSLLEIKLGDYESAQNHLESLVVAQPNYSNARWYLATIYGAQGNFDQAIEQVSKVLELNPGNQTVADRLNDLEAGKAAVEIPRPLEDGESTAEIIE